MEKVFIGFDTTIVKDQIQEIKYKRLPSIGMHPKTITAITTAHVGKSKTQIGKK